jgi:hypothetical protein
MGAGCAAGDYDPIKPMLLNRLPDFVQSYLRTAIRLALR